MATGTAFEIVGGPEEGDLMAAFQFAHRRGVNFPVHFDIIIGRNGYSCINLFVNGFIIDGLVRTEGDHIFEVSGKCKVDFNSFDQRAHRKYMPYNFEASYDTEEHNGWIMFFDIKE